jgi:hypothetical protein
MKLRTVKDSRRTKSSVLYGIQRAAQAVLQRPISPKGVFRFTTHAEFEEWKKIHEAELPGMDTIRQFLNGQLDS